MRNETPVTVVGTVVKADEKRRVGQDQAMVLNLRVAANERRFDRAAEQWVDGDTLYVRVNCWRALAENAAGALLVGDPVIVTGRLRTKEWFTDEGERRSRVELEASAMGPDLARCSVSGVRKPRRDERPTDHGDTDDADAGETGETGETGREDAGRAEAEPGPVGGDESAHDPLDRLADGARPLAPAGT